MPYITIGEENSSDVITIAAAQFAMIGSADAQFSKTKPATATVTNIGFSRVSTNHAEI